jgi:hypothetical protein
MLDHCAGAWLRSSRRLLRTLRGRTRARAHANYYEMVRACSNLLSQRRLGKLGTKVLTGIDVLERDNFKPLRRHAHRSGYQSHRAQSRGPSNDRRAQQSAGVNSSRSFLPNTAFAASRTRKSLIRKTKRPVCRSIRFTAKRAGPNPSSSKISTRWSTTSRTSARASTLTSQRSAT